MYVNFGMAEKAEWVKCGMMERVKYIEMLPTCKNDTRELHNKKSTVYQSSATDVTGSDTRRMTREGKVDTEMVGESIEEVKSVESVERELGKIRCLEGLSATTIPLVGNSLVSRIADSACVDGTQPLRYSSF